MEQLQSMGYFIWALLGATTKIILTFAVVWGVVWLIVWASRRSE